MQITIVQAIFIGLWAMVAMSGTLLGTYTGVPLIYAAGVGVILAFNNGQFQQNILANAIIVGTAGQIVWLGFGIGQGGVRPPDAIAPGIFAPVIAILATTNPTGNNLTKSTNVGTQALITLSDAGTYIGFSIAVGILMQMIITALFISTSPLSNLAKKAIMDDKIWLFRFYSNLTLIGLMFLTFIFGLVVGLSGNGLNTVSQNIPVWLRTGLRVAGGMLPALGFALILKIMIKKEYLGFACLGFFLAIVFETIAQVNKTSFSVIGLTIAAVAIVLIILSIKKLANIKDGSSISHSRNDASSQKHLDEGI